MKVIFWLSATLIVYTYFIYPVILYLLSKLKDEHTVCFDEPKWWPSVSLIIAAYNEDSVIEDKLINCLSLNYPKDKIEIIVASDGSTDKTNEIVKRYSDYGIRLIDYKVRGGKIGVLNKTVKQVNGEILVFSDANTFYDRESIKRLVRNFNGPEVGAVCGELRLKNPNGNFSGEGEGLYWKYEVLLKKLESNIHSCLGANGGIYAIRKELYSEPPSNSIVDDFIIAMNVLLKGKRVIYDPLAFAAEDTAKSLKEEFKRRVRISAGNFQSILVLRKLLNPYKGFVAFAFWSHKVIRWFVPFFMLLCFICNLIIFGKVLYIFLFFLQLTFYLLVVLGRFLCERGYKQKILYIPYYFGTMNLALFLGFMRFARNSQKITWEKAQR